MPDHIDWLSWGVDPFGITAIIVLGVYLRGVRKWKRRSRPHSRWRTASFVSGSIVVLIALMSPLDLLAERYFLLHQIQHILLRMVGPVLIMLGAPVTPILRGLPESTRAAIVRPLVTSARIRVAYGVATHPVIMVGGFVGIFVFWLIPGPHDMSVNNSWIHLFMHGTLFGISMLFWWEIIDPKPRRSRMHYGARSLVLGLVAIPNTVVSAGITFADSVLYSAYDQVGMTWVLEPIIDQQAGGVVGWLVVDMMSVVGIGIVFTKWYRSEMSKQVTRLRKVRRNHKNEL